MGVSQGDSGSAEIVSPPDELTTQQVRVCDGSQGCQGYRGLLTCRMGLRGGEPGRLWGCRGSASQLVGDSLPCSDALYSVMGCNSNSQLVMSQGHASSRRRA